MSIEAELCSEEAAAAEGAYVVVAELDESPYRYGSEV